MLVKMKREKSDGLGYFNLARGLGMFFIVLGHSVNPLLTESDSARIFQGAGTVLGGGIMAAFFMISGFGFFKRSPKKCFSIQKKMLLKPYGIAACSIVMTKLVLAFLKQRSFRDNGGELIPTYLLGLNAEGGAIIRGIPIESVSIFWFILALFGAWNFYNAIVQMKSENIQMILVTGCTAAGYFLTKLSKIWPFCLPMALIAVGYLAAGEWIRKHGLLRKKLSPIQWLTLLLPILVSSAFGYINIVACEWRLGLLDVLSTFCMGYLLLRIYACVMEKERRGKITAVLEEIGLHSIWVVSLHAYEKYIFPWHHLYRIFSDYPALAVLFCFCGRCLVMYFMYRIVRNLKKRWKRKKKRCVIG